MEEGNIEEEVLDLEGGKHPVDVVLRTSTRALLNKASFVQRYPMHLPLKALRAFSLPPNAKVAPFTISTSTQTVSQNPAQTFHQFLPSWSLLKKD